MEFGNSTCMGTGKPQAENIAQRLAASEHLQLLCSGGTAMVGDEGVQHLRYWTILYYMGWPLSWYNHLPTQRRCGGLSHVFCSPTVQTFLFRCYKGRCNQRETFISQVLPGRYGGCHTLVPAPQDYHLAYLQDLCDVYVRWKGKYTKSTMLRTPYSCTNSLNNIIPLFAKLLTCCEDADSKQSPCLLQLFERAESNSQEVLND